MLSHGISAWSATWSVHDQSRDHCLISHVISACSVTWSVHDQPRDQCMIAKWSLATVTWSIHVQSRDLCMIATWSVRDQSCDQCVISHALAKNEAINSGFWARDELNFSCKYKLGRKMAAVPLVPLLKQVHRHLRWEFPGGPVAKTPPSHCRGPQFNPWLGN